MPDLDYELLSDTWRTGSDASSSESPQLLDFVFSSRDAAFIVIHGSTPAFHRRDDLHSLQSAASRCAGTGGVLANYDQLASFFEVVPELSPRSTSSIRSPVADMVSDIRASLSLRITELSASLHVERPTVYAWLSGESTPLDHNYERLRDVWQLARWWRGRSTRAVGNSIRQPISDAGTSVADLLNADPLPVAEIKSQLSDFAASSADELRAMDLRPAEFAVAYDYDTGSKADQDDRISMETGRRMGAE